QPPGADVALGPGRAVEAEGVALRADDKDAVRGVAGDGAQRLVRGGIDAEPGPGGAVEVQRDTAITDHPYVVGPRAPQPIQIARDTARGGAPSGAVVVQKGAGLARRPDIVFGRCPQGS